MIFPIHKMTPKDADYFRYIPATPELRRWGLGVTAAGRTRVSAGSFYPPTKHPGDHDFEWTHGRVLEALQIVLISEGGGWLETRATGKLRVEPGTIFLLLPNVWHRYCPDLQTGWTESWIELEGPVVDQLLSGEVFSQKSIRFNGAIDIGLEEALERIHRLIRKATGGFQPELSAAALNVLALCERVAREATPPSRIRRAVNQAERYLVEHHAEPVNMESLAVQLGVAYSHLRREFRTQTGCPPWQYLLRIRLTRARKLLSSSDATLDHIAERVGFSSGFHLSNSFKQAYGQSPAQWRRELASKWHFASGA